ncbi:GNAT family N-acetyltransferase [Mangrovibacter plantisponsor]|uniref:Ribosomal protein S18 acetylase RimI-like enzyme n=1 Tax=Mangrovibacter plantisponsor TaxID=451513 RepID=A0A317Q8S4_9ENTR|nr:GNAT family N-acetyltransferase [Mangrovibacter plantisponsor]PWW12789.1 ribosomal protein S18 acetylase RimI-like enzyme [Mangrovibacter plantisponsor]
MTINSQSIISYSAIELSEIMNACFERYVIPIKTTPEYFISRFISEGISFNDSCVWKDGENIVAITIICLRSNKARLAAFALAPEYRGKGLAKKLLNYSFQKLKEKNIQEIHLEVIQENHVGVELYNSLGFNITRDLVGFKSQSNNKKSEVEFISGSYDELVKDICRQSPLEVQWLISPLSFHTIPCKILNYVNKGWAVLDTLSGTEQLRYIFITPEYRRQGFATNFLRDISVAYPGITTPVAIPGELQRMYLQAGFFELPIKQYEMVLTL